MRYCGEYDVSEDKFNSIFNVACRTNNIKCMNILRNMDTSNKIKYIFRWSVSKSNNLEAIMKLKEWGANDYNIALRFAAISNNLEMMKLFKEWGATNFDGSLKWAALGQKLEAMEELKKWGANYSDVLFVQMAQMNKVKSMIKLKEWGNELGVGINVYDRALDYASYYGKLTAMEILKVWINNSIPYFPLTNIYNNALNWAASNGQLKSMKLLKEWGANDYTSAIGWVTHMIGAKPKNKKAIKLLQQWIDE